MSYALGLQKQLSIEYGCHDTEKYVSVGNVQKLEVITNGPMQVTMLKWLNWTNTKIMCRPQSEN